MGNPLMKDPEYARAMALKSAATRKANAARIRERQALRALGGDVDDPETLTVKQRAKLRKQARRHTPPSSAPTTTSLERVPGGRPAFAEMSLTELREWTTEARSQWDEAMKWLKQREGEWSAQNFGRPCANCKSVIDVSRGRFVAAESYRDELQQIQTRYWCSITCKQAWTLKQSPQYAEMVRVEAAKQAREAARDQAAQADLAVREA